MANQAEREDAITKLISPPGPTPDFAVRMDVFSAYTSTFYPDGEVPLTLGEMRRPDASWWKKHGWERFGESRRNRVLRLPLKRR